MSSYYGLILVVLTFVSGIVWLIDSLTAGKKRKEALTQFLAQVKEPTQEAIDAVAREPIYVDYSRSFFPILLFIVVLRSFLYEPFQIPSASMKPTLTEGDFILVNKYNYGLRLPVTSQKFIETGSPQRGDVAVFKAPHYPHEDYIKRVIGLPGDTILYTMDKRLFVTPYCEPGTAINDCPQKVEIEKQLLAEKYIDKGPTEEKGDVNDHYLETIFGVEHGILNDPTQSEMNKYPPMNPRRLTVPPGHYFVMGDNRDSSYDGRYWTQTHFVPEENLVGQAVSIWMHLDFGIDSQYFGWIPTGIDISRIGGIQ